MTTQTVRSLAGEDLARMNRVRRWGKTGLVDRAEKAVPPGERVEAFTFCRTKGNACVVLTDRRVLLVEPTRTTDIPLGQVAGVEARPGRLSVTGTSGDRIEVIGLDSEAFAAFIRGAR